MIAIPLCFACAVIVSCIEMLIFEPRARGTADAVRPARPVGVPITDPAEVRAKVAALLGAQDTRACPYPAPTREQPALREQFRVPPYVPRNTWGDDR